VLIDALACRLACFPEWTILRGKKRQSACVCSKNENRIAFFRLDDAGFVQSNVHLVFFANGEFVGIVPVAVAISTFRVHE